MANKPKPTLIGLIIILAVGVTIPLLPSEEIEDQEFLQVVENNTNRDVLHCNVDRVIDGDTIKVSCQQSSSLIPQNESISIRFCGVDTVEKSQTGGKESLLLSEQLIESSNNKVLVIPVSKDMYGRVVGDILVKQEEELIHLGLTQIQQGYGVILGDYYKDCYLGEQMLSASQYSLDSGLFVAPELPREFRRR